MTVFNFKKRFIISLVLLTLSLSLFVLASWGWFTQLFEEDIDYTVGHVEVEIDPYFYSPDIMDVCVYKATGIFDSNGLLLYDKVDDNVYLDSMDNEYSIDLFGNLIDSSDTIIITQSKLLESEASLDRLYYFDASNNLRSVDDIIVYTYVAPNYYDVDDNVYELSSGDLIDSITDEIIVDANHLYSSKTLLVSDISNYYYLNGATNCVEAIEYDINSSINKTGVFKIVIDSRNSKYFFENFRLDIIVKSTVPTYIRIQIFEQLTLTYTVGDVLTELSILNNEYMPFDYDLTNWHDQRIYDNYLYYKYPVKRVSAEQEGIIQLIPEYDLNPFPIYDDNYSLQLAFALEAVQANGGPKYEWNQEAPTWDYYGNLVRKDDPSIIEVSSDKIYASHASIHQFLSHYYYIGTNNDIYSLNNSTIPVYVYDGITGKYTFDDTSYELDINGNLVLTGSTSSIIIGDEYLFDSIAEKDLFTSMLFYTNQSGSLLDINDQIIYTKNTETNIYTYDSDEFLMIIIEKLE